MKLTFKGIGWLIFGILIIGSSVETYGWRDRLSTIGIGVTLIAVYVMKQFFKPRMYGFFIAGGVMLSFCIYNGINEELIIPLAIAAACLGIFYFFNKRSVDSMIDDMDPIGSEELENFDYLAPESYEDADADSRSADGGSSSAGEGGGTIEIETKVPAPKAKTVEFDLDTED